MSTYELLPGETTEELMERTSLISSEARAEEARKRRRRQQFLASFDRVLGVSKEKHLKVRQTESKLGIQFHFGLFRHTKSYEEFE